MAKRNFTNGYRVYKQLQNAKTTGEKKYFGKTINAIMEYREKSKNTAEFDFNKAFKMYTTGNLDEAYIYLSNWLEETDDGYDGENWYGEKYQ